MADSELDRTQNIEASETRFLRGPRDTPASASFREAFDVFPIPLALIRRGDGRILYTNAHLDRLFGAAPQSLWSGEVFLLFPRLKDRRRLERRLSTQGRVEGLKVRGKCQDGSGLWLKVWQGQIVWKNGDECVLTALCDITEDQLEIAKGEERAAAIAGLLQIMERERTLVGHEIHDGVLQELTAALMHVHVARQTIKDIADAEKAAVGEQLEVIERLLRDGIRESRRLIDGVRVPSLDEVGLTGALSLLVRKVTETSGVAIDFQAESELGPVAAEIENAFYRIAQETLSNIVRHSKSPRARVELVRTDKTLELTITDWGIGFDPAEFTADEAHLGLTGQRKRAALINGNLSIDSTPGVGTVVRVQVPMQAGVAKHGAKR